MSVKNILKDLRKVVNNSNAERAFQYESHVIDFQFNFGLTADEIYRGIADYIIRRRKGKVPPGDEYLDDTERQYLRSASSRATVRAYQTSTIKDAHEKRGYKIFSGPTAEDDLARYAGWPAGKIGKAGLGMTKPTQGKGKLGVILKHSMAFSAPQPESPTLGQAVAGGITATYIASMEAPGSTVHNQLINDLWYPAVKEAVRIFKSIYPKATNATGMPAGKGMKPGQFPTGATPPTGKIYSPTKATYGRRGAIRLHGPLDSTRGGGDTSVPVISIIDELKTLNPKSIKKPKNLQNTAYYDLAFRKILSELDLEFVVNSNSITDIVTLGKAIRIKMAQGGGKDQHAMSNADRKNVEKVLNRIEADLIEQIADPGYIASTPVSKLAEKVVVAQVVKNFMTKSGKPDMRYKVNKQAALRAAQRKEEKDSGVGNFFKAGALAKTGIQKGRKEPRKRIAQQKTASTKAGANNPIALKELINQALPEAMLLKMQPPSLRNRTGRFRQSAEVTNVTIGPRGGTDIDYTYMRDPYETFEPGGKMGSRNRDPRKLIGGTVREIAVQITGNKFIRTRRQ